MAWLGLRTGGIWRGELPVYRGSSWTPFCCTAVPFCAAALAPRLECAGPDAKGGAEGPVRMPELPGRAARCSGGQPKGRLVATFADAAGVAPCVGLSSAGDAP